MVGARADVLQSLLTGNIERNAEIKLGAFGLERHVDLEIGGYGSDHGTRSELVGIARRKARERRGVDVPASRTRARGRHPARRRGRAQRGRQGGGGGHRAPTAWTSSSRPVPTRRWRTCATPTALLAALEG